MGKRDYPRLTLEDFGRQLILSFDLDPVYVALNASGFSREQKLRWLVAYIAFYHCGFASWVSEREGGEFWSALLVAARNESIAPVGGRWPRGRERRHFRGAQATQAICDWSSRYRPEEMFEYIAGEGGLVSEVIGRAKEHRSIAEWSGYKCADLVDACLGLELDQRETGILFYDTPRESMLRYWREWRGQEPEDEESAILEVLLKLSVEWHDLRIPHKPWKRLDYLALETCFCKFLSHLNGHYPLGNDIHEITVSLETWASVSDSALKFLEAMPSLEV